MEKADSNWLGIREGCLSVQGVAVCFLSLVFIHYIVSTFYEAFVSPLSAYPGPFYCHISNFPAALRLWQGTHPFWIDRLHRQYGKVVRITPSELSYVDAQAYKDIYGQAPAGKQNNRRDERFYGSTRDIPNQTAGLNEADDSGHARMRKVLGHGFSSKAMTEQEYKFQNHTSKLVRNLKTAVTADPTKAFDMAAWYNFTTFDIMSDICFGEPLHLLDTAAYVPWISAIFNSLQAGTVLRSMRYWQSLYRPLRFVFGQKLRKKRLELFQYAADRFDRRLAEPPKDPDLWSLILDAKEKEQMTVAEMHTTSNALMIAGTETTATLVTALTYYLLKNPAKMQRLVEEIRNSFDREHDIRIANISNLEYLNACIQEGLRIHPPGVSGLHRRTPIDGTVILGRRVPGNTAVYVSNYACFRSETNFRRSHEFIPERWLPEGGFDTDNKSALQPFSTGPRNCMGKTMAYVEMRMILIKMLWNFNMKLCDQCDHWAADQKVFLLWEKKPLLVQLDTRELNQ